MVGESRKVPPLKEVTEVSHCQVKGEELAVESAVLLLNRPELPTE